MDTPTVFNLLTLFSLVLFFLIAKWYVLPALLKLGPEEALVPLLLFSAFRYLGLAFLVPGWTAGLPRAFAVPAAYGDLTVAILALGAAVALRYRFAAGTILAWLYAVAGALDFMYAGFLGGQNQAGLTIGPLWPLMTILGPAWMVTIVFLFRLLIWPAPARSRQAMHT
jgi:hypothetical protein